MKKEIDASIADVLQSCYFIGSPHVKQFEKNFATFIGTKHCIGVNSGTDAIKLSLKAAGVKPGDEIITAANTFVATVGANDLLATSGARYFFGACRFGPVDIPISGPYSSFGGVEVDVETQWTDTGFGMHYIGLSGDIPVAAKVRIRSGLHC